MNSRKGISTVRLNIVLSTHYMSVYVILFLLIC